MKTPKKSLQEISHDFKRLARSKKVKGVILQIGNLDMPFSRVQGLRDLISMLQEEGKEVIVWASSYTTQSYYLALAADRILLQEGGVVHSLGFNSKQLYMKKALDWAGLEFDVVQITPYKSAMERFTRSQMSEEVKEMQSWLLDSFYEQFSKTVASRRGLEPEKVEDFIQKSPFIGEQILENEVVDDFINLDDLPGYLGTEDKPARLSHWDECKNNFTSLPPAKPGGYIAVLRVQGNIVDGKSQRPPASPPVPFPFLFNEQTGDLTFTTEARRVLKDKRAKGVLLYIDSGGGSATSSEAMSAALQKIADKKPLVAYMGSVAASGGYYVATPASYIVAHPGTITGSIGVISARIVNSKLLEKLLLNRESLQRGQKDLFDIADKPFDEEERKTAMHFIENVYELFLKRVAESRGSTSDNIDKVGGGRVWTGEQALEHGLIDDLGGLEKALSKLREIAKLPPSTPVREFPPPKKNLSPLPTPESWIEHSLSNISLFKRPGALLSSPLFLYQNPEKDWNN